MRFDLPLTAFALESSSVAAGALSGAHTLTVPAPALSEVGELLVPMASGRGDQVCRTTVLTVAPTPMTLTL